MNIEPSLPLIISIVMFSFGCFLFVMGILAFFVSKKDKSMRIFAWAFSIGGFLISLKSLLFGW
ncbi:MAG: hypothetical protein DRM99_00865 [Thermoplasmata archaeon]|nr:MAG: hypothetical protein DRM99_00865 [Thermoplasmata archaeon]